MYVIAHRFAFNTAHCGSILPQAATNNSRSFPRVTTSYTSLVRTGTDTGYVLYGMGIRAFTMAFRLVPNPIAAA